MVAAAPSACDLADLILLPLTGQGAGMIVVEPAGDAVAIRHEIAGALSTLATVDRSLGTAAVARLALLADLAPGLPVPQIGRVRVALAGSDAVSEVLLAIRTSPAGLVAELHRVGQVTEPRSLRPGAEPGALPATVGMYRILGKLGRGGMGVVYRAEHIALEKPVALKVLHPEIARNPGLVAQFIVEARAACRARHPGIVDVTDFGHLPDGRPYLVMELIEWPTLAEALREGALAPRRALAIAGSVADALGAAAAQGVVHRDLTPANIFLGPGDGIKIGDFGLARIVDARASSDDPDAAMVVGTAGYMSPEQALCDAVDTRSDIYALGVVLFRMLTGRLPFEAATLTDALLMHLTRPVPRLIGPGGPLPAAIQAVVEKAMAKRREDRYAALAELQAALREAERALGEGAR